VAVGVVVDDAVAVGAVADGTVAGIAFAVSAVPEVAVGALGWILLNSNFFRTGIGFLAASVIDQSSIYLSIYLPIYFAF